MEVKPHMDFVEQAKRLKEQGISFTNSKEVEKFLARNNYYRLSGYLKIIKKNNNDENIDFNQLKKIYNIDKKNKK